MEILMQDFSKMNHEKKWEIIIKLLEERIEDKSFYEFISRTMNSYSLNLQEVGKILVNCGDLFTTTAVQYVEFLANQKYYDGRNEASVLKCKYMVTIPKWKELKKITESKDGKFEACFIERMRNEHRTLQQNFCKVVFSFFDNKAECDDSKCDKLIKDIVKHMEAEYSSWKYLPYI